MLSLDSPSWSELEHAYGNASDVPHLLRQLRDLPAAEGESEPWFSLWSALAHQGDVYSASFAAVPHVVAAAERNPTKASETYFQFPACVEISRQQNSVTVPEFLASAYFGSLAKLPSLVAAASEREWGSEFLSCALAAIAASKGQSSVAAAALELTPEVAEEFMEWFLER